MTAKKKESFESSMKDLDTVVERLEAGNLSLDESIKLYEKGMALNSECEQRLKDAEKRIEDLKEKLAVTEQGDASGV